MRECPLKGSAKVYTNDISDIKREPVNQLRLIESV